MREIRKGRESDSDSEGFKPVNQFIFLDREVDNNIQMIRRYMGPELCQ